MKIAFILLLVIVAITAAPHHKRPGEQDLDERHQGRKHRHPPCPCRPKKGEEGGDEETDGEDLETETRHQGRKHRHPPCPCRPRKGEEGGDEGDEGEQEVETETRHQGRRHRRCREGEEEEEDLEARHHQGGGRRHRHPCRKPGEEGGDEEEEPEVEAETRHQRGQGGRKRPHRHPHKHGDHADEDDEDEEEEVVEEEARGKGKGQGKGPRDFEERGKGKGKGGKGPRDFEDRGKGQQGHGKKPRDWEDFEEREGKGHGKGQGKGPRDFEERGKGKGQGKGPRDWEDFEERAEGDGGFFKEMRDAVKEWLKENKPRLFEKLKEWREKHPDARPDRDIPEEKKQKIKEWWEENKDDPDVGRKIWQHMKKHHRHGKRPKDLEEIIDAEERGEEGDGVFKEMKEAVKEWLKENKPRLFEKLKEWREKHPDARPDRDIPEEKKQKIKEWWEENKDDPDVGRKIWQHMKKHRRHHGKRPKDLEEIIDAEERGEGDEVFEEMRKAAKEWLKENKPRVFEKLKEWREKHPDVKPERDMPEEKKEEIKQWWAEHKDDPDVGRKIWEHIKKHHGPRGGN